MSAVELARDEGEARALRAERVQEWKHRADRLLDEMRPGDEITADGLAERIGLPDDPTSRDRPNNVVGAYFSAKSKAGVIEWTGRFQRSGRVVGHGNQQRVWRKTLREVGGQRHAPRPRGTPPPETFHSNQLPAGGSDSPVDDAPGGPQLALELPAAGRPLWA